MTLIITYNKKGEEVRRWLGDLLDKFPFRKSEIFYEEKELKNIKETINGTKVKNK